MHPKCIFLLLLSLRSAIASSICKWHVFGYRLFLLFAVSCLVRGICDAHWCVLFCVCWRGIDTLLTFAAVLCCVHLGTVRGKILLKSIRCGRSMFVASDWGKCTKRNASAGFPATQFATFSKKICCSTEQKGNFTLLLLVPAKQTNKSKQKIGNQQRMVGISRIVRLYISTAGHWFVYFAIFGRTPPNCYCAVLRHISSHLLLALLSPSVSRCLHFHVPCVPGNQRYSECNSLHCPPTVHKL